MEISNDAITSGIIFLNAVGTAIVGWMARSGNKKMVSHAEGLESVIKTVGTLATAVTPLITSPKETVKEKAMVEKIDDVVDKIAPVAAAINPALIPVAAIASALSEAAKAINNAIEQHSNATSTQEQTNAQRDQS